MRCDKNDFLECGAANRPVVRLLFYSSEYFNDCHPCRFDTQSKRWRFFCQLRVKAIAEKIPSQLFFRCAIRRVKLYRNIELAQIAIQGRADNAPFELAIATPERRDSQRSDSPFFVMKLKILQATNYIFQSRDRTPVIFFVGKLRIQGGIKNL